MTEVTHIPSDGDLVRAARAGDTRAFEQLVERHLCVVHAIAFARLRNRETAEDLAQEVFLRAYLFLAKIQFPDEFAGWIVRVTRNLATDWIRREQRKSRLINMVPVDETHDNIRDERTGDARERAAETERDLAVQKAVFSLPGNLREIVLLHYAEGLTQREIADRLAVHPATVGRQLKSALASMQSRLDSLLRESAPTLATRKRTTAKALGVIAAVALAPSGVKASLIAAADDTAWAAALSAGANAAASATSTTSASGLLPTLTVAAATGGKLMLSGKMLMAFVVIAAGIGGVMIYRNSQSGAAQPAGTVMRAQSNAAAMRPAVAVQPRGAAAMVPAAGVPMVAAAGTSPAAMENLMRERVDAVTTSMRSLANALEAFRISTNAYPACEARTDLYGNQFSGFPDPPPTELHELLSSDALAPDSIQPFGYCVMKSGGKEVWLLFSPGPDGKYDLDWTQCNPSTPRPSAETLARLAYDPTNGVISPGDIWRIGP